MSRVHIAVLVVAPLAIADCKQSPIDEFDTGQITISSGQPNAKLLYNSDGSQISVDFGPVVLGTTVLETFSLSNVGSADMTFLKVVSDLADPSFSTDLMQGQKLVAGGPAVPVTVRFAPMSLGLKGSKITVTTDAAIVPTIELTLTGQGASRLSLGLAPTSIDFGKVLVNTTATQTLTLTNQCGVAISPTVVAPQGTDALLFATVPAAGNRFPLSDQQAAPLVVSFSPVISASTPFRATLAIPFCYSDAGQCAPSVALQGIGVSTCLSFSPAPLDFGSVPAGQSVTKVVTLSNDCSNAQVHLTAAPVVLNELGDGGTSSAGAFQPGTGFPDKDTLVAPGQSIDFPIAFTSSSTGAFTGELSISTDDATNSGPVVLLTATAGP